MKQISGSEALQILAQNGPECMIASDTLGYLIKNKESVPCYWDDTCIIFVDQSTETDLVTVVPLAHTFDSKALVNILNQGKANPNLLIDTQKLSETFLASLDSELSGFLKYERTFEDLMYQSKEPIDCALDNVRLLDSEDIERFAAVSSESIVGRPPLRVLFDVFVTKKQGFILGAFDEGQIVGYLSFFQMLPGVFDVDYIYINPPKRGLGIGTALGNAYIKCARDRNHIAYWSNAQNDASKATALSCGFRVVRQAKKYIKD